MAIFSNLLLMHICTLLNNKNRTRLSNQKFDNVKKTLNYISVPVQDLISSVNRIIIYDLKEYSCQLKNYGTQEKNWQTSFL